MQYLNKAAQKRIVLKY